MSVVGFDFGCDSCVVAVAKRQGIETVQNSVGNRKTASLVSFQGKRRFLGDHAVPYMRTNAKNSIQYVKRVLGMCSDDPALATEAKYITPDLVPAPDGMVRIKVEYEDKVHEMRPELVAASLFSELKDTAEKGLGMRVSDCVIAVPFFWPDGRRRALLDAARAAGLNVLRLFNENTAVALTYGIMRPLPLNEHRLVAFVDFGLTQFSCSLVSFTQKADGGELTMLATSADQNLGCRDLDNILAAFLVEEIKEKYKMDVSTNAKAMQKLLEECKRTKITLSANLQANWGVEFIMNDKDVKGIIKRETFEAEIKRTMQAKFEAVMNKLFEQPGAVGLTKESIHYVEVVGGGVRIPCVSQMITDFFGKEVSRTCDGDESIARGCTWQCAMLSPSFRVKKFEVKDINSYPIELAWGSENTLLSKDNFGLAAEEKCTEVFGVGNTVPSLKLVSFLNRKGPFNLVARYKDPIPLNAKKALAAFKAKVPAPAEGEHVPKLKLRCRLDLNNCLEVSSGIIIKEITQEVPDTEASPTPMETDKDKPAEGSVKKEESTPMETEKEEAGAEAAKAVQGATPMDTSEDGKTAAPVKMKTIKKQVKEEITVESLYLFGLDAAEQKKLYELETHMEGQDRNLIETEEARNALEGYYLEMRGLVEDEEALGKYVTETDREAFVDACRYAENWVEGDGFDAQKSEYIKELEKLKVLGDPIQKRKWEEEHRGQYADKLKKAVLHYSRWAESTDEKYSHIEQSKFDEVKAKAAETDKWLVDCLIEQEKLPKTSNPSLTCEALQQRHKELVNKCDPIMNTPKPKPKKKEEPKQENKETNKKSSKKSSKGDKGDKAPKKAKKDGEAADEAGDGAIEPEEADKEKNEGQMETDGA